MQVTDKITLTIEDNMLLMKRYPDQFFDLAIIDPPYGINAPNMKMGENKGYQSTASKLKGRLNSGAGKLKNRILNTSDIDWDGEIPTDDFWKELFRVSKNQIVFGGNYFPQLWKTSSRGIGYWNKEQPWDNFSQFELIWTSFDCPAFEVRKGSRGGNNVEKKIHPTQKPVFIYKYLLEKLAKAGDKILDTHLGSGSIAIACHDYGFELTACEKQPAYAVNTLKRLENHISQLKLF